MASNIVFYGILFVNFCLAISVHEFAHASAAYWLGDSTARDQGRLTLNPLAHLDPVGTICLVMGYFGWGKPVPVDPRNLRNPRRDGLWISAAGPSANLLLAILFASVLWFIKAWPESISLAEKSGLILLLPALAWGILLNLSLMFFNLLPIFPLDGEKVIVGLIPARWVKTVVRFRSYGMVILVLLLASRPVFGVSPMGWLLQRSVYPLFKFLVPSVFEGVI
ncbi:MAG: site-2 protease family protein [bacterium]